MDPNEGCWKVNAAIILFGIVWGLVEILVQYLVERFG